MSINRGAKWTGLAADLGASSGKIIAGQFDGQKLTVEEVQRFDNIPVQVHDTLHWDTLRIYHEIKLGVRKAYATARHIHSIGIDSWGVDFGLLDQAGQLVGNPVHYRDHRTDGMMEKVFAKVPRQEIFKHSGIQFMPINTIFQLAALKEGRHPHLERAETMLLTSDLLGYFLTGQKASEFTNASTTQLLDPTTGDWAHTIIKKLGLPEKIFVPVVQPGTTLGKLLPSVSEELNGLQTNVISSATHDTACAVAATPAKARHFAYVSCGTWSLVGTEVTKPVLTDKALELNFTNEGGVAGTYRLLKNIMGLWLLQETKREWERTGRAFTWPQLTDLTAKAPAFVSLIDPDDPRFLAAGDMPGRIREYCRQHQQPLPQSDGALLRCVTESLALKYRWALERIEELTGHKIEALHMVGGGIQNELLCQWAANASGRVVIAGPIEGSAIGNLVVQLIAAKEAASLSQAREIVARSFGVKQYEPAGTAAWTEAYARFSRLISENES